jgi:photosystem II stability/assembly factor-like uncharacterized protein
VRALGTWLAAIVAAATVLGARGLRAQVGPPALEHQPSGTTVLLQAVSAVDERVVWVSGHGGTVVMTADGGRTWRAGVVPGADTLQFRDVHGVSATSAYLLSAGAGTLSRIYRTEDGGRSWALQFVNEEPEAFFDCMDFWDPARGLAFSDAVRGRFVIMRTVDGGASWVPLRAESVPVALPGEGAFAASGTCVVVRPPGYAWIGTGAGGEARVLRSADQGDTWSVGTTPLVRGSPTSGIVSLAFWDSLHGIAAGGELSDPERYADNVAVTADGGRTWTLGGHPPFTGAVYGVAHVPGTAGPVVVAVGPKGAAYSTDGGISWRSLSSNNYWGLGFAEGGVGWLVGPRGRITRVAFPGGG